MRRPAAAPTPGRGPEAEAHPDSWEALRTLVRVRLWVATVALPVGVLLRPDADEGSWWITGWSLLLVGALSAVYWLGIRARRARVLQIYVQLALDVVGITLLAALTGGRDSQFVLFFGLVVLTGGLVARLGGGLFAAAGASLALELLPWIAGALGAAPAEPFATGLPRPGMFVAFLAMVGVLSGVLGERLQRTREDLERTARELDRVRVDNDVVLRHLATGVFTVDDAGHVAYLNPAAEQLLALRALAVRGQPLAEALPERLAPLRDLVADTLERRTPRARAELRLSTTSGQELPIGISTNVLMHEDGVTGVVAVFQDLTEVREMERRMRRSETLAEVGALAAGIAHELRNGLNPISGSVECLQRELRLEGENAVLMDLIATECARLNRFVTDLLTYSRERDLAYETFSLDDTLGELCELLARDARAGSGVQVRHDEGTAGAVIRADREQLRQVWLNLGSNALDALAGSGTLTVRSELAGEETIVVVFEDTGAGIAAEDLLRIGQPFFTTKKGGTGLGLAIAQRIVERHGGTLTFESAPGRGTSVRVTLPCRTVVLAHAA